MDLLASVQDVFDSEGPIASAIPGFRSRPGQIRMASEVAHTLNVGGVLVVEAGTGVGKTFAYLVPALLSRETVIVSTATKTLQDQLFSRDIPRLLKALGVPARVALLKGRGSYLCLQRMETARQDAACNGPRVLEHLAQVENWATVTRFGDIAELHEVDESSTVIPLVTSNRDNCLGSMCIHAAACFVNRARREALLSDVVVVNHHLFFADWNVRESGVAELLPSVKAVIFDEAHRLNEIGVQFLGQQVTTSQLDNFSTSVAEAAEQMARGFADWNALLEQLQGCIQRLRYADRGYSGRKAWIGGAPEHIGPDLWQELIENLTSSLNAISDNLAVVEEISPVFGVLSERAQRLRDGLNVFTAAAPSDTVRWMETGSQIRLVQSPLNIAVAMQKKLQQYPSEEQSRKSWIFTSATLGHEPTLAWFTESCGLTGARTVQVDSPFDYASQAAIFVPTGLPKASDPGHTRAVALLIAQAVQELGGRTMVLTTTLRAMRLMAQELRQSFSQDNGVQILVQGEASKMELVDLLCSAQHQGQAGRVLVGSASFWEGVDIPGDALQLLFIDKLPFAPPDDPLVQARSLHAESQGKSAFKVLHLPHAAVALKQGAGRLIRQETDRGILVVCDGRLTKMGYGKTLLAALPPMRRLSNEDEFFDAVRSLTRPSTTDQ